MTNARHLSPAVALGVAAGGIGLFSIMDAFMKSLVLAIGVYNALMWRTLLQSAIGGAAWRIGGGRSIGVRALRLHLARGALTTAMALLFFWGLARVPMAQAIALTYIAPLLALLLGAWLLGERVGARVVVASVAALAGVAVILAGQMRMTLGPEALAGAGAILASAILYAANLIVARLQSQAAAPREIAFVQSAVTATLLLCAAPWLAVLPRPKHGERSRSPRCSRPARCSCSAGPMRMPRRDFWRRPNIRRSSMPRCWGGCASVSGSRRRRSWVRA
ncbi:EamA family transporter [Sphingomonas sp. LR60]